MPDHAKIHWRKTCSPPNQYLRIRPQRERRRHVQKSFRQETKVRVGLTPVFGVPALKLRRCPHSVATARAALPSMSLIPFAPFLPSLQILNSIFGVRSLAFG